MGQSCPADAPIVELPATLRDSVRRLWAAFRTDDDRWADLAREVPGGFAGMMLEGGLVVFLVDTTQRDAALAARGALQGREPKRVRVRKARWDFAQLIDWYHYLNLSAWSDSGEVQSDIDEEHNRISYGVMGESGRRRLERVLAQLRPPPPCFLVAIEVVGPPPEKAVSRVPARLGSDTTRIILPDTVSRGREFPMTVPTFGGGCIRELAPTDVSDRLLHLCTRREQLLNALVDVPHFPVPDWPSQALLVAIGIETDFLVSNLEAHVIGCVHIGFYPQKPAVQCLRSGEVLHGVDDRVHT